MKGNSIQDPTAFHDFEQAGWEANVAEYDSGFARLTSQSIDSLLDAVRAGPGVRLLDVACGPGYAAAAAARPGARATGIDFSAPMVAQARRTYPEADSHAGDAEPNAFAEGPSDSAASNHCIL